MSDTLCGPSNALQTFQKRTQVDRTLQQDRLVSRQSPSQGFRSQNPGQGALDPEFAAFESNLAGAPLPDLQHGPPFAVQPPHFAMASHAEPQSWASDFQKLQISGPSHLMHQQPGLSAPTAPVIGHQGWQAEFMNHQQHRYTPIQPHQPYAPGFQSSFAANYPVHGTVMDTLPATQESITSQQSLAETFDESAFEAAFEQAREDMASQAVNTMETRSGEPTLESTLPENATLAPPQETIKIGSDTIPETNKDDTQARINDADELARTAGHLLDSVRHDQSQKFRDSNFLALMRRIRDREVEVEGDDFRESRQPLFPLIKKQTSQSLHPGGKYYPGGQQSKLLNRTDESVTSTQKTPNGNIAVRRENEHSDAVNHETSRTADLASSIGGPGPGDDNSLYAGWKYGDRWA